MSTAISIYRPRNLDEAFRIATEVCASGLFPKLKTPAAAFVFMMTADDLDLSIAQGVRIIEVIEGKGKDANGRDITIPSLNIRAEGQVALVRRHPRCAYFRLAHDPTDPATTDRTFASWETNTVEAEARGEPPKRASFSLEDARKLGFLGGETKSGKNGETYTTKARKPWVEQPEQMLIWRAATRLVKREWSHVTLGLPDEEEALDLVASGVAPVVVDTTARAVEAPSTNARRLEAVLGGPMPEILTVDQPAAVLAEARAVQPSSSAPSSEERPRDSAVGSASSLEASKDPEEAAEAPALKALRERCKRASESIVDEFGMGAAGRVFAEMRPWQTSRDPEVLGLALKEFERLYKALRLGARINAARNGWRAFDESAVVVLLETPEKHKLEELQKLAQADEARLAKMRAGYEARAREPGSDG